MNYYEIGQRIRRYRKALNLSQEELAEKVGISTTHMSHIETGNTKLSLPVLVDLSNVLSVQTDAVIFGEKQENKTLLKGELSDIIDSCNTQELNILMDLVKALKISLDKYHS